MFDRPSWDEYFIKLATEVAKRSTCLRRQVGAVIVDKDNHILATGYNGAPAGLDHCIDLGYCYRQLNNIPSGERHELCRAVHAEMNAIIQAAKHGTKVDGGTIYLTHTPCVMCAKALINAGIQRIISAGPYPDVNAMELLNKANVEVIVNA